MSRNSMLKAVGALVMILAPCPSFAIAIQGAHYAGCNTNFVGGSLPVSQVTPCAVSTDIAGNSVTTNSLLQSRFGHTSVGAYLDFSQAFNPTGSNFSVT